MDHNVDVRHTASNSISVLALHISPKDVPSLILSILICLAAKKENITDDNCRSLAMDYHRLHIGEGGHHCSMLTPPPAASFLSPDQLLGYNKLNNGNMLSTNTTNTNTSSCSGGVPSFDNKGGQIHGITALLLPNFNGKGNRNTVYHI
eukprot:7253170-Ditylum_brightwellii.AAC.1